MRMPVQFKLSTNQMVRDSGKRLLQNPAMLQSGFVFERVFDEGFSLLEATVSLLLGTVFLSASMMFYLSLWDGYNKLGGQAQSYSMALSLRRLLVQDIHAASEMNAQPHSFTLLVNGTTYRYYLNDNGQCVRVRLGGGTTVLADDVQSLTVSKTGRMVRVEAVFQDKYEEIVKAFLLSAIDPDTAPKA